VLKISIESIALLLCKK